MTCLSWFSHDMPHVSHDHGDNDHAGCRLNLPRGGVMGQQCDGSACSAKWVMWWKTLATGYHWSNKALTKKFWIKTGKLNYIIELGNVLKPGCAQKWTVPFLIRIDASVSAATNTTVGLAWKLCGKTARCVIKNKHDVSFEKRLFNGHLLIFLSFCYNKLLLDYNKHAKRKEGNKCDSHRFKISCTLPTHWHAQYQNAKTRHKQFLLKKYLLPVIPNLKNIRHDTWILALYLADILTAWHRKALTTLGRETNTYSKIVDTYVYSLKQYILLGH